MTTNILVPIDGSPLSHRALRHALTEFPDASITMLHVVDLFEPGYGAYPDFETSYEPLMGSEEWYERAEEISEQLFEEAQEVADDYDRDISTASEIGDPKRIIVDFADDEEIDHIVLGAHGRMEEVPVGNCSRDIHPDTIHSTRLSPVRPEDTLMSATRQHAC